MRTVQRADNWHRDSAPPVCTERLWFLKLSRWTGNTAVVLKGFSSHLKHLHKFMFFSAQNIPWENSRKISVNERMWKDRGGVRRRVYGGDVSLVFSWIHHKNLREQRRGKESSSSGLFFLLLTVASPCVFRHWEKERWLAGRGERNGLENPKQTRSRAFRSNLAFERCLCVDLVRLYEKASRRLKKI